MKIKLVQNDTRPVLQFEIAQNGAPINLSGSTVKLYLKDSDTGTVKINGATCTIVSATDGTCQYLIQATDTDIVGNYVGEIEVTFPDGTKQTGYKQFSVIIRDDI